MRPKKNLDNMVVIPPKNFVYGGPLHNNLSTTSFSPFKRLQSSLKSRQRNNLLKSKTELCLTSKIRKWIIINQLSLLTASSSIFVSTLCICSVRSNSNFSYVSSSKLFSSQKSRASWLDLSPWLTTIRRKSLGPRLTSTKSRGVCWVSSESSSSSS